MKHLFAWYHRLEFPEYNLPRFRRALQILQTTLFAGSLGQSANMFQITECFFIRGMIYEASWIRWGCSKNVNCYYRSIINQQLLQLSNNNFQLMNQPTILGIQLRNWQTSGKRAKTGGLSQLYKRGRGHRPERKPQKVEFNMEPLSVWKHRGPSPCKQIS